MKLTRRQTLAAAGVLLATPAYADAEFNFKIGFNVPDNHPMALRVNDVAKTVLEKSNGKLAIKVFPNSLLGGDTEMLSQVRSGGMELFGAPTLTLSTLVALSGLPSVGYAFKSYDQIWAAMDGKVGDLIRTAITKAGLVPLGVVWDNGFRQVTSSKAPIKTPADFTGLKIRVPNTALLTALFSAFGASPTSINVNELYSALQTHVVEAQENPLALIDTQKMYEVQKYCTMSSHCWSGYWITANRRVWSKLPEDLQHLLQDSFNAAALVERADLARGDAATHDALAKKGLQFNTPDPAPFQAALRAKGFYTQWKQTYGGEAWDALEHYTGALA